MRYGSRDETPIDPAEFDPPAGAFYVGYRDGTPVSMGGWRFRDDVTPAGLRPPGGGQADVRRAGGARAAGWRG